MKAVMMAGGEGSRLRPLTVARPKPMVPIVNKSVMAHILDLLREHGITDIIITLRYMAATIQDYFEDGTNFGVNISYVVEENPLGTAGSVRNAAPHIDDTFLVISGDAFTDFNLSADHPGASRSPGPCLPHVDARRQSARIRRHRHQRGWTHHPVPGEAELGRDHLRHRQHRHLRAGTGGARPDSGRTFRTISPGTSSRACSRTGCLHMATSPKATGATSAMWKSIGEPMRDLLQGKVRTSEPIGRDIGGGIWVGKDVDIAPSAQLFGPIYLGDGVKIKGDVTIYGPSVIRDYTVIDAYTRIERSILWRNNYVGENCELRGVVVTRQCSLKSRRRPARGRGDRRQLRARRGKRHPFRRQAVAAQAD